MYYSRKNPEQNENILYYIGKALCNYLFFGTPCPPNSERENYLSFRTLDGWSFVFSETCYRLSGGACISVVKEKRHIKTKRAKGDLQKLRECFSLCSVPMKARKPLINSAKAFLSGAFKEYVGTIKKLSHLLNDGGELKEEDFYSALPKKERKKQKNALFE